jgi:hypothetical protein
VLCQNLIRAIGNWEVFNEGRLLIGSGRWVATVDNRTTEIDQSLNARLTASSISCVDGLDYSFSIADDTMKGNAAARKRIREGGGVQRICNPDVQVELCDPRHALITTNNGAWNSHLVEQ